ncbi:MAG: hypothetical protein EPN84_04405 [Legionella sp.]|nr:MAG: hypothetical protein EPN84_04405 [Legionella sp.]
MNRYLKSTKIATVVVGMLLSMSTAWAGGFVSVRGGPNVHYHRSGVEVYNWDGYNRGGYFYGGGGWFGPNVVINVPAPAPRRYYRPYCENVEVCSPYGDCWIERYCD